METPEELQHESQALLSRIRPLLEGVELAIKRDLPTTNGEIDRSCQELKRINRRWRQVQKLIRSGAAVR